MNANFISPGAPVANVCPSNQSYKNKQLFLKVFPSNQSTLSTLFFLQLPGVPYDLKVLLEHAAVCNTGKRILVSLCTEYIVKVICLKRTLLHGNCLWPNMAEQWGGRRIVALDDGYHHPKKGKWSWPNSSPERTPSHPCPSAGHTNWATGFSCNFNFMAITHQLHEHKHFKTNKLYVKDQYIVYKRQIHCI